MSTTKRTKSPLENYLVENPNAGQSEELSLLDKHYGASQNQLNRNRDAAVERADISYEKAKKYLPIQNKMNGLSGLGVSETASIDLYNRHANNRSAIDSSHNTASADLFQNYLSDRQGILDKEYERGEAKRLEQKEDKMQNYLRALEMMTSGDFADVEGLGRYLNEMYWSGQIDDSQMEHLKQRFENVRTSPDYADKLGNTHHDWEAMRAASPEAIKKETKPYATMLKDNVDRFTIVDRGNSRAARLFNNSGSSSAYGNLNETATVKTPDGEELSLGELRDKLINEGYPEESAIKIVLALQKKLRLE